MNNWQKFKTNYHTICIPYDRLLAHALTIAASVSRQSQVHNAHVFDYFISLFVLTTPQHGYKINTKPIAISPTLRRNSNKLRRRNRLFHRVDMYKPIIMIMHLIYIVHIVIVSITCSYISQDINILKPRKMYLGKWMFKAITDLKLIISADRPF